MDKLYINKKIENCKGLVDNATSEDQKEIYQGYLEFWEKKLGKKPEPVPVEVIEEIVVPEPEIPKILGHPIIYTNEEMDKLLKEPEPKIADNGKIICDICGNEFAKAGFPNHRVACEKKKFEKELQEARDKLASLDQKKEFLNKKNEIE